MCVHVGVAMAFAIRAATLAYFPPWRKIRLAYRILLHLMHGLRFRPMDVTRIQMQNVEFLQHLLE